MYVEKQVAVDDRQDSPAIAAPTALTDIHPLLCEADWSLVVLSKWLPVIAKQAHTLAPVQRTDWLLGLRSAWQRHGWAFSLGDRERLFEVAAHWGDWHLVLAVADSIAGQRPVHVTEMLHVIDAFWQLGDTERALDIARRLCLSEPANIMAVRSYAALQEWLDWLTRHPFAPLLSAVDGSLYLEPLGHHHLPDFAWQYFDPDIAKLCCLPVFESDAHWHRWVAENDGFGDQLSFVVLHNDWGFVGSVNLIQHDGVGFVFYWIGADFRGHGLAAQATALLLEMARQTTGLHTCYAKVFEYNGASCRTLERLGFERAEVRAESPHEDEVFYRQGPLVGEAYIVAELTTLLKNMDSDVVIEPASMPFKISG